VAGVVHTLHRRRLAEHERVARHTTAAQVALTLMQQVHLRLLHVFEIRSHHGDVHPSRRDPLGNLGLARVARVGILDRRIFDILEPFAFQHARLAVVKVHLHVELLQARTARSDADSLLALSLDNLAGQRADKGLEVRAGVEVVAFDFEPRAAGLRSVARLDVRDNGVDEFVEFGGLPAELGYFDDDRAAARFPGSRSVNL
jgi:hypothetical protein